jgi:hypothetical protein
MAYGIEKCPRLLAGNLKFLFSHNSPFKGYPMKKHVSNTPFKFMKISVAGISINENYFELILIFQTEELQNLNNCFP